MKSKLYKTHRNPSYYRLRRLGYFSLSLMIATIIVVVPLTLAQASTSQDSSSIGSSSSIEEGSISTSDPQSNLDSSDFNSSLFTTPDASSSPSDLGDTSIPTRVWIEQ
jgi:hypothetical protein